MKLFLNILKDTTLTFLKGVLFFGTLLGVLLGIASISVICFDSDLERSIFLFVSALFLAILGISLVEWNIQRKRK